MQLLNTQTSFLQSIDCIEIYFLNTDVNN